MISIGECPKIMGRITWENYWEEFGDFLWNEPLFMDTSWTKII
jgi:hypothetical protein